MLWYSGRQSVDLKEVKCLILFSYKLEIDFPARDKVGGGENIIEAPFPNI